MWTQARDNGSPVLDYLYQICEGQDAACDLGVGNSITSWQEKRAMCRDGSTITLASGWCEHPAVSTPFKITMLSDSSWLQPLTTYTLVVRARNDGAGKLPAPQENRKVFGIGFASARLEFTTRAVPFSPYNTTYESRSVSLEWAEYTEGGVAPTEYIVNCESTARNGSAFTSTLSSDSTQRKVTFHDLTPGSEATFTVRARVQGSLTGPSFPTIVTLRPEAPDAPEGAPNFASLRTTSLTASWVPAYFNGHPLLSYTLVLTSASPHVVDANWTIPVSGPTSGPIIAGVTSPAEWDLTALSPATTYTLRIGATNAAGLGPLSEPLPFSTCSQEPDQVPSPQFLNRTTSSVALRWTPPMVNGLPFDNGAPITNYEVQYQRTDAGFAIQTAGETGSDRSEMVIDGLLPGRGYVFRVAAFNGVRRSAGASGVGTLCSSTGSADGWGPWGGFSSPFAPAAIPPQAPLPVEAIVRQGLQLQVGWTAQFDNGANITAYTVYTNASEAPLIVDAPPGLPAGWSLPVAMTDYFSGLVPNSPYAFQVPRRTSPAVPH